MRMRTGWRQKYLLYDQLTMGVLAGRGLKAGKHLFLVNLQWGGGVRDRALEGRGGENSLKLFSD